MAKPSANILFITIVVILSIITYGANSEVFTVGDDEEWDSGVNYADWSQKYNFTTGDVLVFKYLKAQHNVYEVTEATFRSCNASSGVLNKYETGNDRVTVEEARTYWFICDVAGHCPGGMRFGIEVGNNSTSNGAPGSPQAAPEPPPPPPPRSNGGNRVHVGASCCLLVLGLGGTMLMSLSH